MRDEIKRLREENRKQLKKRAKSKKQIIHADSVTEVLDLAPNLRDEQGDI